MKTPLKHFALAAIVGLMACHPSALFAQATTSTTTVVSSNGTVSDFKPNNIALKVGRTEEATNYSVTKTTTVTDENGNPVSTQAIQSGAPVTVFYDQQGPNFVAERVVVHHSVTTAPVATTTTVATTPPVAAPVETATTTTTTAAPDVTMPPSANGVVTDLGDSHIDVRSSSSPHPIHYRSHDSTAFVDESGNRVDRDHVTLGSPVTVFFEQDDDGLTATRVVLRNPASLDR